MRGHPIKALLVASIAVLAGAACSDTARGLEVADDVAAARSAVTATITEQPLLLGTPSFNPVLVEEPVRDGLSARNFELLSPNSFNRIQSLAFYGRNNQKDYLPWIGPFNGPDRASRGNIGDVPKIQRHARSS